MATTAAMAAKSASIGGRFCHAARTPLRKASPSEEREGEWGMSYTEALISGLKGLPASAGVFRVGIGDAEACGRQSILVVDDRSGEVNQAALLDEKLHAVCGEFLIAGLAGGDFHRVGHPGTPARFDVDTEALVFGVRLADDFGDMSGGALGGPRDDDFEILSGCCETVMVVAITVAIGGLMLAQRAPCGPVLHDPIQQRLFKAYIVSRFFAFNPFMAKNLRPLSEKLLIKSRFVEHNIVFLPQGIRHIVR